MLCGGLFQSGCSQYELLEHLNTKAAAEYNRMADLAVGVKVYVGRMADRTAELQAYVDEFKEVERQVADLEEVVSVLDKVTTELHQKVSAELSK